MGIGAKGEFKLSFDVIFQRFDDLESGIGEYIESPAREMDGHTFRVKLFPGGCSGSDDDSGDDEGYFSQKKISIHIQCYPTTRGCCSENAEVSFLLNKTGQ